MSSPNEGDISGSLDIVSGSLAAVLGFTVVIVILIVLYRLRYRSTKDDLSSVLGASNVTSMSAYTKSEAAPLAKSSSNDDEEWGWEDSSQGGDDIQIELTSTKKDDDQDLTMAFSITGKRTSIQPQPTTSDPVFHRASHVTSTTSAITTSSQIPNPTGVTTVPAPTFPHTTPITSLETSPAVTMKKKTIANSTQSDDVFTSMGLASTPSFTSSTTSKSAVMPKASTNASKKSSSLSAIDLGLDSNWEDDGDLDDLLDD